MAETSIKISLELADKAAQKALGDFIDRTGTADKSLDKLKKTGSGTFSEISVGIGKSIGVYDIFVGNLAANVAIKSFEVLSSAANSLFQTFIVDGVKSAAAAQSALNSLNFALAQSGIYSKETSQEFQDFAEELQNASAVEDDVIIKNAALIQSLASLSKDGLKQATQAALDLSAGLAGKGLTVEAASEALGKAANGNVAALQKLGLEIRKGRTDAETFANTLKAVEERFGGAAASKIATYEGAVAQAANTFGNLTEEIGNLIVKNPAVIAVVNEVSKIFSELSSTVKGSQKGFSELVGEGLSSVLEVSAYVITGIDAIIRAFQTLIGVTQALLFPIVGLGSVFRVFTEGVDAAANRIKAFEASAVKNLNAVGSSGDGALATLSENLLRLRDSATKGTDALRAGADGTVEPLNKATGAMRGLASETDKANERSRAFALDLIKQGESNATAVEAQLNAARLKADNEIAIEQDLLNRKLISQTTFLANKAAIDAQYEATRQELELQKFNDDNVRLNAAFQQELISNTEFLVAKQALEDKFRADQSKADIEVNKRRLASEQALVEEKKRLDQERTNNFRSTLGTISTLQQSSVKEFFFIGKAAAIAQTTIDGIAAVQKALASAPPPFNFALAGLVGAATAVNVQKIATQQPPSFEDGGIVPGSSFFGDRVAANVNSGEMILNRQQQKTLFGIANGSGVGGIDEDRLAAKITNGIIQAIGMQPVNVNIGGKTVVDTLRSELASGRSFA